MAEMTATTQPGITLERQMECAIAVGGAVGEAILASLIRLREINSKLLEIRESLHAANETPAITDTLWMRSGVETIFDAIDALLLRGKP